MNMETVDRGGLWPWMTAAMFAPAAQSLGSSPWPWTLALSLGAMAVFLCVEMATGGCGQWGRVMAAVQFAFLAVCAGAVLRSVGVCWAKAADSWVIPGVVLVLAACSAERGVSAGTRSGATLFWFIAIAFIVLAVFSVPDVEPKYLYPGKWESRGTDVGVLLIPGLTLLLPRQKGKNPWPWALTIIVGAGLISVLTAGALSGDVAAGTKGAFFEMIRGVEILGVAERFEALVAAAMTLGWFCLLSLLLCAAGTMGKQVSKGTERLPVWLAAGVAVVVSLGIKEIPGWGFAIAAVVLWYGWPLVKALAERKRRQLKMKK